MVQTEEQSSKQAIENKYRLETWMCIHSMVPSICNIDPLVFSTHSIQQERFVRWEYLGPFDWQFSISCSLHSPIFVLIGVLGMTRFIGLSANHDTTFHHIYAKMHGKLHFAASRSSFQSCQMLSGETTIVARLHRHFW